MYELVELLVIDPQLLDPSPARIGVSPEVYILLNNFLLFCNNLQAAGQGGKRWESSQVQRCTTLITIV